MSRSDWLEKQLLCLPITASRSPPALDNRGACVQPFLWILKGGCCPWLGPTAACLGPAHQQGLVHHNFSWHLSC